MSQHILAWTRYETSTDVSLQVSTVSCWQRETDLRVANEVRALAELPLEKYASKFHLDDDSDIGRRILWLLEQSERNRDVSPLEEAGELLMEQSTRVPAHWRSPAVSAPPVSHGLPDDVYRFSPMSNDPFAKVGFVRVVESRATPHYPSVSNEPQHTAYPDLLVNPPERWIKHSPRDPQPMRLPNPLFSSYSWLDQQVQRQIGSAAISNTQQPPYAPVKPKPVKAVDPYRVRKPAATPKSKSHATKTQTKSTQWSGTQGIPQLPVATTNPYFSAPKGKENMSGYDTTIYAYPPYSSSAAQIYQAGPAGGAQAPVKSAGNLQNQSPCPGMVVYNQFPPPPKVEQGTHPAPRPIVGQQPYDPTTYLLPQPPAIRIPTTPLIPSSQAQMPWIMVTYDPAKPGPAATKPTETNSYDEVFRKAQETADNLAKMLGTK